MLGLHAELACTQQLARLVQQLAGLRLALCVPATTCGLDVLSSVAHSTPCHVSALLLAGSCGRCYEVACRPAHIRDGYGNDMDRTGTCKGTNTVTVRITDTCPCYYPSNQYSNTRW